MIADLPDEIVTKLNVAGLEPLKEFLFGITIDDVSFGVNEISGISDAVNIKKYKEGGYPGLHRIPFSSSNKPIIIKRKMMTSRALWNWFQEVKNWTKGKPDYRRSMSIFMIERLFLSGQDVPFEVWRWDFDDCWPSKWVGPSLNSMSNNLADEAIKIQYSNMTAPQGVFSGVVGEIAGLFA